MASGQKFSNPWVKIFAKDGANKTPRVGIPLSSKDFKLAVDRNRARRLVASAIQPLYPRLKDGLNLIVMPKPLVLGISPADLSKQLEELFVKSKLLR
ncbi:ribonuclease P protein component [Candidatus Daviesbacteria bacterium]|nr:ribonuclease P protein component [Candidatus Daviesbacteria bacterium]